MARKSFVSKRKNLLVNRTLKKLFQGPYITINTQNFLNQKHNKALVTNTIIQRFKFGQLKFQQLKYILAKESNLKCFK